MDKPLTSQAQPKTDAEYQAEVERLIAEMKEMVQDIQANRQEIEASRRRTRVNLQTARAIMDRWEKC